MLVLSRRLGEAIVLTIGDRTIRVIVAHMEGDKVRLAFDADQDVKILREELLRGASNESNERNN